MVGIGAIKMYYIIILYYSRFVEKYPFTVKSSSEPYAIIYGHD